MDKFRAMRFVVCFTLVSGLSGCMAHYENQLRGATSASIGCPTEEITLSGRKYQFTHQTWVAECRGVRYFCRQDTAATSQIVCSKEAK